MRYLPCAERKDNHESDTLHTADRRSDDSTDRLYAGTVVRREPVKKRSPRFQPYLKQHKNKYDNMVN